MRMKSAFLALLLSTTAFAGPREDLAQRECYAPEPAAPHASLIPQEICLEAVKIDPVYRKIAVESALQPGLFIGLRLDEWSRKAENFFGFKASKHLYYSVDSGCGISEVVKLIFSGNADSEGESDPARLDLFVVHSLTMDTCHSTPQVTIYRYRLRSPS